MLDWADQVLGNHSVGSAEFVAGMAFHWYNAVDDRTLDGTSGYNNVRATHEKYPDSILLATEGCSCPGVWLGNWFRAERLGHDLMFDISNWATGWIDWNLLVDYKGGPNHLNNMCDAPIIANHNFSNIIIQPKYYTMGHFSKYVPPGSKRINSHVAGNYSNELYNPNIQSGVEVGLYACEDSSRQLWTLTEGGSIQLSVPAIADVQLSSEVVKLCLAPGLTPLNYVRILDCSATGPDVSVMQFEGKVISQKDKIYELKTKDAMCLTADSASYNGVAGGTMVTVTACKDGDTFQHWILNRVMESSEKALQIISAGGTASSSANLCLTAGWPFLNTIAFTTLDSTVVVVTNESPKPTKYSLTMRSNPEEPMYLGISERAIQTIVLRN